MVELQLVRPTVVLMLGCGRLHATERDSQRDQRQPRGDMGDSSS
jgi:hypothetical protein